MNEQQWRGDDDAFAGGGLTTIFRDVLLGATGAMVVLVVVILGAVNVPGREHVRDTTPPGNIIIESYWDNSLDVDVDQWVQGPEDVPVGYSNLVGRYYNLLRDDLGRRSKNDPINYESTFSRGIPEGKHCVNLQLYANRSKVLPIKVKVTVKIAKGDPGSARIKGGGDPLLVSNVQLRHEGQEINVFCFFTDANGDLVPGKTFRSDAVRLRSPGEGDF